MPSTPATESNTTLIDFIYSVPSPVTTELVALSPYIYSITHLFQIISWRSHWTESWLAVGAWWALCLFAYPALRYFLPILLVASIVLRRWISPSPRPSPLITEKNLQSTLADLTTIHALIPHLPPPAPTPLPTLLRIALLTYPNYLLLTYFVPLRILLGMAGTFLLTWRAPWNKTARQILWGSAYIRWTVYHLSAYLTGNPLPPKTISSQTHQASSVGVEGTVNFTRLLFTIYENQRWWMGLDWTAALLPAERPSWCSASHTPVSPPNAFSLPPLAVSYLPASSTPNGDTKDPTSNPKSGKRMKRTARWSWEEGEWRVMVRREGHAGVTRVERPLPSEEKETSGHISSSPASRIFKGVGKKRESSDAAGGVVGGTKGTGEKETEHGEHFDGEEEEDGMVVTDPDGWVYGDNKWEGGSAKGGLGKYTRYRRWTRIAVLTETIELVDDGDFGVVHSETVPPPAPAQAAVLPPVPEQHQPDSPLTPTDPNSKHDPISGSTTSPASSSPTRSHEPLSPTSSTRDRGMLRQRLKAVVDGAPQ